MDTTPVRQQPETPETEAAGRQWQDRWASGPRRTRWTTLPVQALADTAPSLDLVDARLGRAVPLSSAWSDGPALLLFWRHFGCSPRPRPGRAPDRRAARVSRGRRVRHADRPGRAGPDARVRGRYTIPDEVRLLVRPRRARLRGVRVARGDAGRGAVRRAGRVPALRHGRRAGRCSRPARRPARPMVDNPWLLPGEFVVAQDGSLVTTYRFQFCEHWIDPRVNVAATAPPRARSWQLFAGGGAGIWRSRGSGRAARQPCL